MNEKGGMAGFVLLLVLLVIGTGKEQSTKDLGAQPRGSKR